MSDITMEQDHIEDNLRQTRSRLDGRLNELQEKLAPGQVVTDLLDYVRGHGGQEFAGNLLASAQKNPLPAVVAGVGLAWLIAANFRGPSPGISTSGYDLQSARSYDTNLERRIREAEAEVIRTPDEADDNYHDRLNEVRGNVLGVARQAQDTAASFARRIQEAVSGAMASASQQTHDLRDRAGGAAGQLGNAARQGSAQLAQGAAAAQENGMKMFAGLVENPVALGAVGLAAGALLGLLVPVSTQEEATLGSLADSTRNTMRDVAQDAVNKGTGVAREVLGQARDSAASKGFTSDRSVEELTGDLASGKLVNNAAEVAREVLQTSKDAVRKAGTDGVQNKEA